MRTASQLVETGRAIPWPSASDDTEREAWVLKELANTLAETVDNNAASLLGQNVGGDIKAGFLRVGGEPTLELQLSFSRSWATVAHSSTQEGFKTWESDPGKGVIYAGYAVEEESGFFSHLAFWSKDETLPDSAPASLDELLAHLADRNSVHRLFDSVDGAAFTSSEETPQGYLLRVSTAGDKRTYVNIRRADGKRLPDNVAKDFLRLLRKNLI